MWYGVQVFTAGCFLFEAVVRLQHLGWEYFDHNKNDFFVCVGVGYFTFFYALYYRDDVEALKWSRWFDLLYIFKVEKLQYIVNWIKEIPVLYSGLHRFVIYYNKVVF